MSKAKNILIVTDGELEAMKKWPLEIRALFDPRADRELAEQIEADRRARRQREKEYNEKYGDELPF